MGTWRNYSEVGPGVGLQPGWLHYQMLGPALGLRGQVIRWFFWLMRAWPINWMDEEGK